MSPRSRQRWIHAVFSNSVALVEPLVPADTLSFTARFAIEHLGVQNQSLPMNADAKLYPFDYTPDDQVKLAGFLQLQYPDDAAAVREWVAPFLPQRGTIHTRDVLANISQFVRSDFQYTTRDAMGTQSPAQTLALRRGTCRDFALLMMEATRGLGMAARFVTGYIYDRKLDDANPEPDAAPDGVDGDGVRSLDAGGGTLGSGATHAWLHVYLPGTGWVPFDPTNTLYGGTNLIPVAVTRAPEQAAPLSGNWTGDTIDFLGMDVSVKVRRRLPATSGALAPI